MTAGADIPATGLPSLADAPWLARPSTRAVLAALEAVGCEGRVVGGAVRNTLMGLPVSDIDVATPAAPVLRCLLAPLDRPMVGNSAPRATATSATAWR